MVCFGCNAQLMGGEKTLCTVCRNQIPFTEYDFERENPVDRLFYGILQVEKASSFLFYTQTGITKNLLHQLKYKNQPEIGQFLGDWYGSILAEELTSKQIDVVVPVPLHPKKKRKRGYNQVDLFAQRLSKHLRADFAPDALIKTANIKTQTKRNRILRIKSAHGLYKLNDFDRLQNKTVLLVDDVITTGATITECGKALALIKGLKLYVASMAFVP